jgi:membrane protein required for colicin V production
MTAYDAAMAGLIVAGMVWGAWRGVTWQLASIASLVLGYSVSHPLSGPLAAHFPGEPVVARALAMLAVYAAASGGVFLAAWVVRATLRKLQFEAYDRHLGMLLGGVEGAVLGLVVTLFVVSLAPQTRAPIFASPSGKVIGRLMSALGPVLPSEVRDALAPFWSPDGSGAAAGAEAVADQDKGSSGPAQRDPAPGTGSLKDLIAEGEDRIGRAVADGAARGLRGEVGGDSNDGTVERR